MGALIRDRRKHRGWDQQTLADRVGVSRLWISEMENGKRSVQLDLVLRVLDVLGIQLNVGGEPQRGAGKSHSAALIGKILDQD